MRRLISFTLLFYLAYSTSAAPANVKNDINDLIALGSRSEGTTGERQAFEFIAERLDQLGIEYIRQSLDQADRGHSFSQNLIANISGQNSGHYILAAPVDAGAFAVALLLELAGKMAVNPPKHNVTLLFLGAERGTTPYHPYGSRLAIQEISSDDVFVVYIDNELPPDGWAIRVGSDGTITPFWLLDTLIHILLSEFIPFRLRGMDIIAARLGLQGDVGPYSTWSDSEIPGVMLEPMGSLANGNQLQLIASITQALTSLDTLIDGVPTTEDTNYIFIQPLAKTTARIISELPYITAFLGISAILLSVVLIRFRNVRLNIRRFAKYWWAWPLLFVLVFVFFFLSTLIIEETLLLADFPTIWMEAPGVFVFFKLAVVAALSLNFILITRGLPLPRSPHFYTYSAVFSGVLAMLVFIAVDITLAAIPLWTIINFHCLIMTRKEGRKILFFALSTIPYVTGLLVIIREPYTKFIEYILLNRVSGSLVLTLLLLPIILTVTGLSYWRVHYHKTRRSIITPTATLALTIASVVILIWILNMKPFGPESPQPIDLMDNIDMAAESRRLELTSPGPIGNAELTVEGQTYILENLGRSAEVRLPLDRYPLDVQYRDQVFLGRRTVFVDISGEENPKRIQLKLQSQEPFTLHEAAYPFEMDVTGSSAEIFIGNSPPFPMSLTFTINADADVTLSVLAEWTTPEDSPTVSGQYLEATSRRVARQDLDI